MVERRETVALAHEFHLLEQLLLKFRCVDVAPIGGRGRAPRPDPRSATSGSSPTVMRITAAQGLNHLKTKLWGEELTM